MQIRMNFCYQKEVYLSSNSSGDSSDDHRYGTRSRQRAKAQRRARAESAAADGDGDRIYFAHPTVFDLKMEECSGANLYRHCLRRIGHFLVGGLDAVDAEGPDLVLFVKTADGGEERVRRDGTRIAASNATRNTATITVQFAEREYLRTVDQEKAVHDVSFETLSDRKPKNGTDLDDCLRLYTAAEVLDDVVWKCPNCKKQVCRRHDVQSVFSLKMVDLLCSD